MKIQTTHYRISPPGPDNRPSSDVTLAVLADLHNAALGENGRDLIRLMKQYPVRAVLSAGDLVTAKGGRSAYDQALALSVRLARIWPFYAANGNHEMRLKCIPEQYRDQYEAYTGQLSDAGVTVLDNRSQMVTFSGMRICLTGFSQPLDWYTRFYEKKRDASDIAAAVGQPQSDAYRILLAHHPDYFDAYAGWGADLTLAGHVHGGTIRLPGLGGLIGADLRPFPHYDKGMFVRDGSRMIVSAGLGCHTVKLRINNPPELVLVTFTA